VDWVIKKKPESRKSRDSVPLNWSGFPQSNKTVILVSNSA
jgi:hypothetical protein